MTPDQITAWLLVVLMAGLVGIALTLGVFMLVVTIRDWKDLHQ